MHKISWSDNYNYIQTYTYMFLYQIIQQYTFANSTFVFTTSKDVHLSEIWTVKLLKHLSHNTLIHCVKVNQHNTSLTTWSTGVNQLNQPNKQYRTIVEMYLTEYLITGLVNEMSCSKDPAPDLHLYPFIYSWPEKHLQAERCCLFQSNNTFFAAILCSLSQALTCWYKEVKQLFICYGRSLYLKYGCLTTHVDYNQHL